MGIVRVHRVDGGVWLWQRGGVVLEDRGVLFGFQGHEAVGVRGDPSIGAKARCALKVAAGLKVLDSLEGFCTTDAGNFGYGGHRGPAGALPVCIRISTGPSVWSSRMMFSMSVKGRRRRSTPTESLCMVPSRGVALGTYFKR
jgi:hypothetical protein